MKIVVLDGYTENPGDLSWGRLEELGEFIVYDRSSLTDEDEAIARIGEAEIVITNKTPITKKVLDSCPSIRYIGVLATGYNVVDYVYAAKKGIPVTNVPGYGTDTVAQFTFALLLEICHHVAHHSEAVHAGRWEQSPDFCFCDYPQIELAGKTMGIIGFGRIGQKVGTIAKAFGMKVLAYSPHEYESGKAIGTYVNLNTLLAESDVISLHCPLFPETEGIINRATIAKMKDGVILLNNGRGPLVVERDLADALNSGKIQAAAVDVVSTEPIKGDNPLLTAKNCFITPHIAWATKEARQRIMDCAVNNVKAFLSGAPENVVNQ
ncbi:Glycerate dehydrogenase [uncultured Clostridium sp.]|nr:Glycerate dehydrogenase [uncultured Clostridium sp.]